MSAKILSFAPRPVTMTATAAVVPTPFPGVGHTQPLPEKKTKKMRTSSQFTSRGIRKARAADPINDVETIHQIQQYLVSCSGKYGYRNAVIFTVGCNIGRRCGDLLQLKVWEVWDGRRVLKKIEHVEEKTGKKIPVFLNDAIREVLLGYIQSQKNICRNDYLFRSQKPWFDKELGRKVNYMQMNSFYKILHKTEAQLELQFHLSTHSMRKSLGSRALHDKTPLTSGVDKMIIIQDIYGHESQKDTRRYVGLTDEDRLEVFQSIQVGLAYHL